MPWCLTAILGIGIILQAHHMRVPRVVQLRMVFNVAIDLLGGTVPVLGDAADFFWKANAKNFALLEHHARAIEPATAGDWLFVGGVVSVIIAVALAPVFVMYWLLNAIGAHFPPFSR